MRTMNALRAAKLPESAEEGIDVGEKKKKKSATLKRRKFKWEKECKQKL